ncbi:lipopolysaccharide biosynthesis protein [Salinimicrobium sp. CAU 1759]
MGLKKTATSGLLWTFLDTAMVRGIGLFTAIILARLLSPVEFGLMGMIYIFTSIATTIVDSGLTSSLIRSEEANASDYTTVFFTNITFSGFLYLILYFCAPAIANFYDQEILITIVRVYGLLFVITSFSAVQQTILIKKLKFKHLLLFNIPGVIFGAATGIFMAYSNFGVWSIIAMQLVTQAIFATVLWYFSEWKPNFRFSIKKFKKHFNFGFKLMLSGLLNSIFDNIYNVIIGKFYSIQQLGQFERAKTFNNYPVVILTTMIGKVTYPLLSGIKEDNERITRVYKQILQFAFFVAVPLMFILAALAEPLFLLVLGNQWEQAAVFFRILCFAGVLYPIHAFNLNLLKIFGRSDWFLKLEIIKKAMIAAVIAVALPLGMVSLVWSVVIISVLALMINIHYTNKLIAYSLPRQIVDLLPTLFIGGFMYVMMYFLLKTLETYNLYLQIIIPASVGILLYAFGNYIFKNPSLKLLWKIKKDYYNPRFSKGNGSN